MWYHHHTQFTRREHGDTQVKWPIHAKADFTLSGSGPRTRSPCLFNHQYFSQKIRKSIIRRGLNLEVSSYCCKNLCPCQVRSSQLSFLLQGYRWLQTVKCCLQERNWKHSFDSSPAILWLPNKLVHTWLSVSDGFWFSRKPSRLQHDLLSAKVRTVFQTVRNENPNLISRVKISVSHILSLEILRS